MKAILRKIIPNSLKRKGKLFIHKGDKYECPLCNFRSNGFYLIGGEAAVIKTKKIIGAELRNGGCYKCDSSDRERLIYLYLKDYYKLFEKEKSHHILHIAPERNLSQKIRNYGLENYVCGDLFTEGYSYPSYVQNMNVLDLPFENEKFDLIICNHVLEHIPDHKKALQEIYNKLKPGGTAILQVPFSSTEQLTYENDEIKSAKQREEYYGQFDHVRLYGLDYPNLLESYNFNVEKLYISKNYPKFGLNENEPLFVCTK
jgi:SAM-dependent methyltransferase